MSSTIPLPPREQLCNRYRVINTHVDFDAFGTEIDDDGIDDDQDQDYQDQD